MKKLGKFYYWLAIFAIILGLNYIQAQEATSKTTSIQVNKETREVKIEGSFNITSGILEFLAASNKTPRDYESLFLIDAKPSQIQSALVEIGLKPCLDQKENGNYLDITVCWTHGKIQITRNILEFIELNQTDKSIKDLQWVFTGSIVVKDSKENNITEDKNGETIALQPGIAGIIHTNIDFGNPYDENKQKGFRINEKLFKELIANNQLPKAEQIKQTKMTLIIKPKEAKK